MKSYQDLYPVVVVGGRAGDFLGEYMAGGLIIVLGLDEVAAVNTNSRPIVGNYVGTGMHGGTIYLRGKVADYQLGQEVKGKQLDHKGAAEIEKYLREFCADFSLDLQDVMKKDFVKLIPHSTRPYGRLYAY
jgi:glutamate synthase domain-containing protein 3